MFNKSFRNICFYVEVNKPTDFLYHVPEDQNIYLKLNLIEEIGSRRSDVKYLRMYTNFYTMYEFPNLLK